MTPIRTFLANTLPGLLLAVFANTAAAGRDGPLVVRLHSPVDSPYYPVMVRGNALPMLNAVPVRNLTLMADHGAGFEVIPFQIDRVDANGQYLLDSAFTDSNPQRQFDAADELVFMAADTGDSHPQANPTPDDCVVLLLLDDGTNYRHVCIIVSRNGPATRSPRDYVHYETTRDYIYSDTIKLTYSNEKPFLIEDFQWLDRSHGDWSADLADTMKVRHRGKLFGRFDFLRTEADYSSRLTAVKDGPIRIIRQTKNQVRVFAFLRSPSIDMDYIVYANHVVMDTTLDLPFKIGWFFSDLTTFASVDWQDVAPIRVYSPSATAWLPVDGAMSAEKQSYNSSQPDSFMFATPYGVTLGTMYLTDSLPISWNTMLVDDVARADPPEHIPGQFGNLGFMTRDWERVDTAVHHLYYSFYMLPDTDTEQALRILKEAPGYGHSDI